MWAFVVSFCKSSKISGLDVYSTIDRIERLKKGLKMALCKPRKFEAAANLETLTI